MREPVGLRRLALHALELSLSFRDHAVRATAPVPDDLAEPLARLGLDRDSLVSLLTGVGRHRPAR